MERRFGGQSWYCERLISTSVQLVEDNRLAILSITREYLLQVLANYQCDLRSHNDEEQERESELHGHNFSIRLYQSDTCVPVESLPGIKDSDDAASSDNLGDDLAAEASIEGNDSFNLVGEKGGLYTGQGNIRRNDKQD